MAKRSNEYWRERLAAVESTQHQTAGEYRRIIEEEYRRASSRIQKEIEVWYQRFAKDNRISMTEAKRLLNSKQLEEFKWDVKDYIKFGEENALNAKWMKQLENASCKVHITRLESLQIQMQHHLEALYGNQIDGIDKLARKIYSQGYYHTTFEIQKGFNIGWDLQPINEKQLNRVISTPWTADNKTFSDRIWTQKEKLNVSLRTELTQTIIRGDSPDNATAAIAHDMKVSKNQAGRLVMTESAYFASAAQKDCYNELDVERFEIVATLDFSTSEKCRKLDGTTCDMENYEPGVTAPPFHCWCRSVTVPYFEDNKGIRAARGDDGKTYYVPNDMKYEDWKKTFVDGDKQGLQPAKENDIIKKREFDPAITINEANEYARNALGIPNASYKGVDIVTANEWNRGLQNTFDQFPELKNNFGFVGEAHERNAALKPVIREHYLDELMKVNPEFTREQLEPYADKKVVSTMNKLKIKANAYAQSWSPSIEPFSNFRGVTVNSNWGKRSAEFSAQLNKDVESKFHPIGCNTIRSVLDHEIGHQLDNLLDIRNIPEVQALFDSRTTEEITAGISRYSWDNLNPNRYSEMIAEAWAEYCNSPEPRVVAKTIGEIINKTYETRFK